MASGRARAIAVGVAVGALAAICPVALAFHGCEENEGDCDNSPTVYICIQDGSCRFDGEGKRR